MRIPEWDYKILRKSIKDGMFAGLRTHSPIGWAIRLWTKGKGIDINGELIELNHVGIFKWIRNELFLIEADDGEVRISRFSYKYSFRKYKGDIFLIDPCYENEDERIETIDRLLQCVDKGYHFMGILQQMVGAEEIKNEGRKFYCSALLNYGLKFKLTGGRPLHIKPQTVLDTLLKMYPKFKPLKCKIKYIGM